jgi:hypothetical protein
MKQTLLCMLVLSLTAALAQVTAKVPGTELTLVGNADVIVLATVASSYPADPAIDATGTVVVPPITSPISITVDTVLKGDVKATDKLKLGITRNARYTRDPATGAISGKYLPEIKEKDQYIFYLLKSQAGYTVVQGEAGMKKKDLVADVQKAIKALPITVTVELPKTPIYFTKPAVVKATLKNTGTTALDVTNIFVDGFYFAPRMDPSVTYNTKNPGTAELPASTLPNSRSPLTIAGGASAPITLYLSATPPAAWALFGPESYLQTPAGLRVHASISMKNADNTIDAFSVAGPTGPVMIGYLPPDDAIPPVVVVKPMPPPAP